MEKEIIMDQKNNLNVLTGKKSIKFPHDELPIIIKGKADTLAGQAKLTIEDGNVMADFFWNKGIDLTPFNLTLGGSSLPEYDAETGLPTGENYFHLTYIILEPK